MSFMVQHKPTLRRPLQTLCHVYHGSEPSHSPGGENMIDYSTSVASGPPLANCASLIVLESMISLFEGQSVIYLIVASTACGI
jgi:hypothetical protein